MTGSAGILLVCTGNQCRSPMAAALLEARLLERGCSVPVRSAGFVAEGAPPPREAIEAMWASGLDIAGHRSTLVTAAQVARADLVVGMTRQQAVDLTVLAPEDWRRIFTLAEVVRVANGAGGRHPDEPIRRFAERLGAGRIRANLLQLPLSEDIPDPMGGRPRVYQRTRDQLAQLALELADSLCPA